MDERELLRELKGSRSNLEMAKLIGTSRAAVRMILGGHRRAGRKVVRGLVAAFPDREDDIIAVFLGRGGHNCEEAVTEAEAQP